MRFNLQYDERERRGDDTRRSLSPLPSVFRADINYVGFLHHRCVAALIQRARLSRSTPRRLSASPISCSLRRLRRPPTHDALRSGLSIAFFRHFGDANDAVCWHETDSPEYFSLPVDGRAGSVEQTRRRTTGRRTASTSVLVACCAVHGMRTRGDDELLFPGYMRPLLPIRFSRVYGRHLTM
jgi:hypothetical protein